MPWLRRYPPSSAVDDVLTYPAYAKGSHAWQPMHMRAQPTLLSHMGIHAPGFLRCEYDVVVTHDIVVSHYLPMQIPLPYLRCRTTLCLWHLSTTRPMKEYTHCRTPMRHQGLHHTCAVTLCRQS
jgi:hypothetical protein